MGRLKDALAAAAVRLVAGTQIKNADRPKKGKHTKGKK